MKKKKRTSIDKARNSLWGLGADTQWVGQIKMTRGWSPLGFIDGDGSMLLSDEDGLTCLYRCPRGVFPKHVHNDSDETVVIQKGRCLVETIDGVCELGVGDTMTIPKGWYHIFKFLEDENKVLIYYPEYNALWKAGE